MPIRLGSRIFAPRAFTTLLALACIALLLALGRWQLHRADEKRALYEAFAAGTDATTTLEAQGGGSPRYQHTAAAGRYDGAHQILIDNMTDAQGRAGYFVITPFELRDGAWVLVNRGWVPVGASRAARPAIAVSPEPREIHGRLDNLPRAGLRLSTQLKMAPPFPVVANFPTHAEIAELLHERAWVAGTEVILLDPGEPDGFVRNWQPPGFPPIRHVAYAVQWFGLALALAVIYVVTNVRRDGAREALS